MAKRFTDTVKWTNNKWFFKLSVELKLFWIYLLDNCDSVGVWEENIELSNIIIGYVYPLDTLLKEFKKQVYLFKDKRKWWIIDFCNFQYGDLHEDSTSKPIQSYISLLKKHGLWEEYLRGIHTLKEKDKVKVIDKEEDKDNINFELFWNLYDKKVGKKKAEPKWNKLTKEVQQEIIDYIPKYIESQPDKKYRKDPQTFLNNESWNDEIIGKSKKIDGAARYKAELKAEIERKKNENS